MISQVLLNCEQPKKNKKGFCSYFVADKVTLWTASYSACVVYTKTIIQLSVGEVVDIYPHFEFGEVKKYQFVKLCI